MLDAPVIGNDAITAHGLYTGALVEARDHSTTIWTGLATGKDNWMHISSPITASSAITVVQSFCHHSPSLTPVPSTSKLAAPIVLGPICPNNHFAKIRGTVINAVVVPMRNGSIVGYGVAGASFIVGHLTQCGDSGAQPQQGHYE
jgi:hypothetical protein